MLLITAASVEVEKARNIRAETLISKVEVIVLEICSGCSENSKEESVLSNTILRSRLQRHYENETHVVARRSSYTQPTEKPRS